MKTIDWYILRKFIGTFFYSILLLIVTSVVVDISEKLNNFVNHDLSFKQIFFGYYIGFIPHITALLFPLFVFIAVIYFTSRMAFRSEIIAMLSGGISFNRLFRPYWIGAFFLGLLLLAGNRWEVPRADRIKDAFEDKYVNEDQNPQQITNIHLRIDSVSYISMFLYDPIYKFASGFTLDRIRGQQLFYKLESETLVWDSTRQAWRSDLCFIRTFHGLQESVRRVADTLLKLPLTPGDLIRGSDYIQTLTTPELSRYIAQQKLRGTEGMNALYVEKYRRDASAAAVVILSIMGAAIASRKIRGGSGLHLAIGLMIGAVYIFFLQFSYTFSVKGNLDPWLAVWLPNFVFGGLAWYLYRKAPK